MTDATGSVKFTTIYPGWYQGRTIHIHFKVRLYDGSSETYEFTSQIFFDEVARTTTVMALPAYNRGRTRDTLNANDNVYGSDGGELLAARTAARAPATRPSSTSGSSGLPASASAERPRRSRASLTKAAFDRTASGSGASPSRSTSTRRSPPTSSSSARRHDARAPQGRDAEGRHAQADAAAREKVAAGSAELQVTLKDAAGNTKVASRTVQVPKACSRIAPCPQPLPSCSTASRSSAGLTAGSAQADRGSMKGRSLEPGESIAVEGEQGVGFFVIESGTARVTVGGEERRMLGPGDYFGEIALISQDARRSATVTADTPVRCWGLTSWEFRPIVQDNATVAWSLLESLAKMLSDAERAGRRRAAHAGSYNSTAWNASSRPCSSSTSSTRPRSSAPSIPRSSAAA